MKYMLLVVTEPTVSGVEEKVAAPEGKGLIIIWMLCVPDTPCQPAMSVVKTDWAVVTALLKVEAFAARLQESRTAK